MIKKVQTLVVGLGQMGLSHALAYHRNPGFEIVGLVSRSPIELPGELSGYPIFHRFEAGLTLTPDLVSINTYTDTHASYAIAAMEAGAHVFVEKPLAVTVEDAERVVATALRTRRKLVVGYILRHHPSWIEFVARARELGPPFVLRMNLNQQSSGSAWAGHKRLLQSTSPLVDCGVHYLDVMLQITESEPVQVRGMGARLSAEIAETLVNYGHLEVIFADGSVGWFESGWGPMISGTAFFVQDVMGPRGSVSFVMNEHATATVTDNHTKIAGIRLHSAETGGDGDFARHDTMLSVGNDPGLQVLCDRQQQFLLDAIRYDVDLSKHMDDAIRSLAVVLAADLSMREGRAIDL